MTDHTPETEMASQADLWDAVSRVRDLLAEIESDGGSSVPVAMVYEALAGGR